MPLEIYAFCAFIFIMIYIGMVLFRFLFKQKNKDKPIDAVREAVGEERMRNLSNRVERILNALEEQVDRQGKRLNQELVDFARNLDIMEESIQRLESIVEDHINVPVPVPIEQTDNAGAILAMSRRGVPQEQIAKHMGIPISAVALIIELGDGRQG